MTDRDYEAPPHNPDRLLPVILLGCGWLITRSSNGISDH